MQSFKDKVFSVVKQIKKGNIMTYKDVANRAGNIKASRAVGKILNSNKDRTIPCHRVVCSNGVVGGYNKINGKNKMEILKKEGVPMNENGKIIF
jgi:O-6-methylguanine DNA methyltransferase